MCLRPGCEQAADPYSKFTLSLAWYNSLSAVLPAPLFLDSVRLSDTALCNPLLMLVLDPICLQSPVCRHPW
jgi:hypothetical protein